MVVVELGCPRRAATMRLDKRSLGLKSVRARLIRARHGLAVSRRRGGRAVDRFGWAPTDVKGRPAHANTVPPDGKRGHWAAAARALV
jgi:hypothetical protein